MLPKIPSSKPNLNSQNAKSANASGSRARSARKNTTSSFGIEDDEIDGLRVEEKSFADEVEAVAPVERKLESNKRLILAKLVGELDGRGEKLATAASIKAFVDYRRTLEKIVSLSVGETYRLRSLQYKGAGVTKEFYFVEKISQEIDSLLAMVSHNAAEKLKIAAKVIEIKGVVVDFLG